MKTRSVSAFLLALSLGVVSTIATSAQSANKPMAHDQMMMAKGPHQALAMAYHHSLAAFAKAVQEQTADASTVNVEFARPAVAEMRRSFDQMNRHHQEHMKTMSAEMHSQMSGMMKQMETHHTDLNTQLTALEQAVQSATPDAKKVSALAASVTAHLDAMSKMHPAAKGK